MATKCHRSLVKHVILPTFIRKQSIREYLRLYKQKGPRNDDL